MAKLNHIAIATKEPESTAHFYRDVFDLQMVGKVDSENAEGYYLSDGNVNIAVLKFKNDIVAGEQGLDYSGIHHIGFQVDDAEEADGKLRKANSLPQDDVNNAFTSSAGGVTASVFYLSLIHI